VRRRDFITLLGGAAAAWPVAARAQQGERMRRIGCLWAFDQADPLGASWADAFMQGLAERGWTEGRNLRVDARWNPRTAEQTESAANELIALKPDVLVAVSPRLVRVLQQKTKTIPIVFVGAGDPLTNGLVPSLSHPGGNATGVTDLFYSIAGKWLELLRECVPGLSRVAVVYAADTVNGGVAGRPFTAIAAAEAGTQYGVTVTDMPVGNLEDIERAIPAFAAEPNGGLIVLQPPLPAPRRKLINALAIRYLLPVTYGDRSFAAEGGLLSYGADFLYMFRSDGPPYVDRILRGEKPGDLPVQFPTKFILSVNLTTARAIGLKLPESLLARADELLE
jgi:putative tryptophan/tyrosine transport system substrate-binding protein